MTQAAPDPNRPGGRFGDATLGNLLALASAVAYAAAVAGVQRLTRQVAEHWAGFDVIVSPTLTGPALPPAQLQLPDPAADFEAQKHFTPWSSVWNITGNPAMNALPYELIFRSCIVIGVWKTSIITTSAMTYIKTIIRNIELPSQ